MWRWLTKASLRLRSLLHRERVNVDLDDELRFHLERQVTANVAAGMSPDAARRAALREFGDIDQIREQCADMRRVNWLACRRVWSAVRAQFYSFCSVASGSFC